MILRLRSRRARLVSYSLASSAALFACVQLGGLFRPVPPEICKSEAIWTYQDKDHPLMNPGRSCIQCHTKEDDELHSPVHAAAGTVMWDLHEADDCRGAASLRVIITDADDVEYDVPTNTAGNFWIDHGIELKMPLRAKIIDEEGRESVKNTPVNTGDCASCHTREGENGAAGRLLPPHVQAGLGGAGGSN